MRPISLAVVFPRAPTAATIVVAGRSAPPSCRCYKRQTEALCCSTPSHITPKSNPRSFPSTGAVLRRAVVSIPDEIPADATEESDYSPSLSLTSVLFLSIPGPPLINLG